MDDLTEVLTYKVLHFKQTAHNGHLLEMCLDDPEEAQRLPVRNVCAKLSTALADRLDQTCDLLSISKRAFIEAAVIHALNRADEIMEEWNIGEAFDSPKIDKEGA